MKATTFSNLVDPLLTDLYQLTMAYGYWKNGSHEKPAVFDLFFRKCPFKGEFAIFAGLEQCLRFVEHFRFEDKHIAYLRTLPEFASKEEAFFTWLASLDCSTVKIHAQAEGSLAFPAVPLLRVEGPLALCQLLETTLLTLVNYASLVTTNAARYRLAAGWDKTLLEFGLRRAQGSDGGVSASYYAYMGGFDASSNVKAGELFGLPIAGTHAHAFVESFSSINELPNRELTDTAGKERDFVGTVLAYQEKLGHRDTNQGELSAFCAYALAFPERFLALVDTYGTLDSGIPNFVSVAAALFEFGYKPRGIRLDSGDLAFLSLQAKDMFARAQRLTGFDFSACRVTASNDINESILHSLRTQPNGIDNFGIGTNLVTCEAQPAFGGVYKLVEIEGRPRIKLSENTAKLTIPGKKRAFRLFGEQGQALIDVLCAEGEAVPAPGAAFDCRSPFDRTKRAKVVAGRVQEILVPVWQNGTRAETPGTKDGTGGASGLQAIRDRVRQQLETEIRPDHLRRDNPSVYKVAVSGKLYDTMQELIEKETVVKTIQ